MPPLPDGRDERRVSVELRAGTVLAAMLAAVVAVLAGAAAAALWSPSGAGAGSVYAKASVLLSLDRESTIPSFVSSVLLLLAAALLALRTLVAFRCEGRRWRLHWALLAAGFALMAADEAVELHGKAGWLVPEALRPPGLSHVWVLPAAALVAGLALLYLPFVRALPARCRPGFVGAGLLYLLGALGLETVGGLIADCDESGCAGTGSAAYALEVFLEEACEMLGAVWFVHALLDHLGRLGVALSLRVVPSGGGGGRARPTAGGA